MKFKLSVKDNDKQWKALTKQVKRLNELTAEAGIFAGDGRMLVKDGDKKKTINMATLAYIHEFGTSYIHPGGMFTKITPSGETIIFRIKAGTRITIPQRSFIRSALIENEHDLLNASSRLFSDLIIEKITSKEIAQKIADRMAELIKHKILSGQFEPLSELTIRLKGHNKRLIDSKRLFRSIKSRIGKRQ